MLFGQIFLNSAVRIKNLTSETKRIINLFWNTPA